MPATRTRLSRLSTLTRRPRVLVTGGSGFIGRALVRRLTARGCRVTVLDNLSTGRFDVTPFSFVQGDVRYHDSVRQVSVPAPDLVVHMASVVGQQLAKGDPDRSYAVSTIGTQKVLSQTGDCPIVFFSSSAVYGRRHTEPVMEELARDSDALEYDGGVSGYAVGKLRAEQMVLDSDRPALVLRPFNVVGPGQTGDYGMVVPRLVRQAKSDQPLTVYGDGSQVRSFSHVDCFVDVLMDLLDSDAAWDLRQPINVGTPEPSTVYGLALEIALLRQGVAIKTIPYDEVYPGHVDVPVRIPDVTRLRSLVGDVEWPRMAEIVEELMLSGE